MADRLGCDLARVEAVLARLQGFEPTGVFARSVGECLALQLKELDRYDPAMAALPLTSRLAYAADTLNFQASWINDAEFAGYFTALDNGYYKAEGLDINYAPGGPDVIPESTLIAGTADITLTTPDTTIQAISTQGAPFKIIGAQYQKNPLGVVSLARNPIKSPADDLIGRIPQALAECL